MQIFNIHKYLEHSVPNAKLVSVKNFYYAYKDGIKTKKKGNNHFDLYFNKKGELLEVVNLNHGIKKSTIFYNSNKQIIKIVNSKWNDNEFISEIDICYDKHHRITYESEKSNYVADNCEYTKEIFYSYIGNICTQNWYDEFDDEHYIITDILDDLGNSIESKGITAEGELKYWCKDLFDDENKYIRTMHLNEDGIEETTIENLDIENYYDEKFHYNERNNWTVKEVFKNNILNKSIERKIIYF